MVDTGPRAESHKKWVFRRIRTHRVKAHAGANKHFVSLNENLIRNGADGDIVATLIHEILHALYPTWPEEEVKNVEDRLCDEAGIERAWLLED